MILERSCRSQIRGWLPRDAVPPLPVKATTVNRKIIDRTFLVGTIAVYLIILAFGAFIYNAFGTPIVWEVKTKVY